MKELSVSPSNSAKQFPAALLQLRGLESFKAFRSKHGGECQGLYPPGRQHHNDVGLRGPCCNMLMDNSIRNIIRTNLTLEVLEIVQGCLDHGFSADDVLPATLNALHTISLKGLSFSAKPVSYLVNPVPLKNLRHATFTSTYSTHNLDILWKSIKAAGTHLKTLRTSQISYHLVDYLASFLGLHELVVHDIEDRHACISPEISTCFFGVMLPKHEDTLETLDLRFGFNVMYIEGWSFSAAAWSRPLASLCALKTLCVHPPKDSPYNGSESHKRSMLRSTVRSYQEIIEGVEHLPSITFKSIGKNVRLHLAGGAIIEVFIAFWLKLFRTWRAEPGYHASYSSSMVYLLRLKRMTDGYFARVIKSETTAGLARMSEAGVGPCRLPPTARRKMVDVPTGLER